MWLCFYMSQIASDVMIPIWASTRTPQLHVQQCHLQSLFITNSSICCWLVALRSVNNNWPMIFASAPQVTDAPSLSPHAVTRPSGGAQGDRVLWCHAPDCARLHSEVLSSSLLLCIISYSWFIDFLPRLYVSFIHLTSLHNSYCPVLQWLTHNSVTVIFMVSRTSIANCFILKDNIDLGGIQQSKNPSYWINLS